MFQTKMFENFIHWTSFGTVKFWTLYWFIRTDFFMISSILGRKKKFFFFLEIYCKIFLKSPAILQ